MILPQHLIHAEALTGVSAGGWSNDHSAPNIPREGNSLMVEFIPNRRRASALGLGLISFPGGK
jgi:hypothetical protein